MKKILLLLSLVSIAACSHAPKKIESNLQIGDSLIANRYVDLYFAGQPSKNDFKKLKEQGFKSIVNIRAKKEGDYKESSEARLVEELGFKYSNVPYNGSKPLSTELMNKITKEVVRMRQHGKVLVHCSSGNRIGVWLAGHFYQDHQYSKEESLKVAKKLGLTAPKAIEKAELYLENNALKSL